MAQHRPKLQAAQRERTGSRYANRLRKEGKLPAVVYGHGQAPAHVVINRLEFITHLHHGVHLLDLEAGSDGAQTCLIKDVQYGYLGSEIIHADLARVDLNEEISVSVPLVIKGQDRSPGAKAPGAIVEKPFVDIEIRCLAGNIPDNITIDIGHLEMDGVFKVSDIKFAEGIKTEIDPETILVSIHEAQEETLEAAPAAEGAAEPEVITAKKEEPAAGAAPAKDAKK
jgi:large subunit ribosomal protein L25